MDQRLQFITDHQRGLYSMTELCARNRVSRKTGYKWLARYAVEGAGGLAERSHAPHGCPHRIAETLSALLVAARVAHPSWGPAKLLQYLTPRHPRVCSWPAVSTVADLLKRHDLVRPRRRRRPIVHPGAVPIHTTAPNDLWTADFKGQFRTRNGIYCFPLTIADQHTRYLLRVHGLLNTRGVGVRPVFKRAFREYGLPLAIRTDNGVPFANTGLHGLTQLNVWWLRWGSSISGYVPRRPRRTAPMSGCTARSRRKPLARPRSISPDNNAPAQPSGANTTTSARMRPSMVTRSCAVRRLTPRLSGDAPRARVSGPLSGQAGDARRDHPLQAEVALSRERAEGASRRPRGERRWRLVALPRAGATGKD